MQLDKWQIEEFEQHWTGSYVLHNNHLCYVDGPRKREQTVALQKYIPDENSPTGYYLMAETVPMNSIDQWDIRSGFINSRDGLYRVSKTPRRQFVRGVTARCAIISRPFIMDGVMSGSLQEKNHFGEFTVFRAFTEKHDYDPNKIRPKLLGKTPEIANFALTRQVAIIRDQLTNMPYVVCQGVIVGYLDDDRIKVNKGAACYMDMLAKQNVFVAEVR